MTGQNEAGRGCKGKDLKQQYISPTRFVCELMRKKACWYCMF